MQRFWLALAVLTASSCELLLPSFKECSATADCQSKGSNFVCQKNFCIPLPQGCQYVGAQNDPALTFGLLFPKTNQDGTVGAWGPTWEKIAGSVAGQINTTYGGIHNTPVRFISCDTTSHNDVAASLAGYMIDAGVAAIISDGSGETISEAALTLPANVLLLSGAATSPAITYLPKTLPGTTLPLVWRTTPSDGLQAPVIARVLEGDSGIPGVGTFSGDGGIPLVAVFERNDAYGQGLFTAFQSVYPTQFVKPPCPFTPGGSVTAAISQCATYNADVILPIGFPNDVSALIQGSTGQFSQARWFFTQGGQFPGIFALSNQAPLQRAIGTAPASSDTNSVAFVAFKTLYEATYNGEDPTIGVVDVANVYDASMLLMVAADYATAPGRTLDGTTLATALTHVSGTTTPIPLTPSNFEQMTSQLAQGDINIDGASGSLDFNDTTGEAPAKIQVWAVSDGGFITLATVPPS